MIKYRLGFRQKISSRCQLWRTAVSAVGQLAVLWRTAVPAVHFIRTKCHYFAENFPALHSESVGIVLNIDDRNEQQGRLFSRGLASDSRDGCPPEKLSFLPICSIFTFILFLTTNYVAAAGGILLDAVHANEDSDFGLTVDQYNYHKICGSHRAIAFLRKSGTQCDRFEEGRLYTEKLQNYRLLLINLLSADRPAFLVSEIEAIKSFIQNGGSLLVIMEHSNAYFHATMLEPLLSELDIAAKRDTACDEKPQTVCQGPGWIRVSNFSKEHPVTANLRNIVHQTGGTVDSRFAVAWTSEKGWADQSIIGLYGKSPDLGNYGNMIRDKHEKAMPIGVILAKEFGKGKIVIFADQNAFSDSVIGYADNGTLWLNAIRWLCSIPDGKDGMPATTGAYEAGGAAVHTDFGIVECQMDPKRSIFCVENFDAPMFGSPDSVGLYNLYAFLSRHYETFSNDRMKVDCELAILANGHFPASKETIQDITSHLKKGKNVLTLHTNLSDVDDPKSALSDILKAFEIDKPNFNTVDPFRHRLDIPNAGSVWIVSPAFYMYNTKTNKPFEYPTEEQAFHWDKLLNYVNDAILAKP